MTSSTGSRRRPSSATRIKVPSPSVKHPLGAEIDGAPPLDPVLPVTEAAAGFAAGEHAAHPAYGGCTHDEFARLHAMHLTEHLPGP
ncbi:DUF1569 domain-containing protein [Streptomyces caeruleatus]|uniref:DUF1569 domain-containing protein n=1 Tax=Streptomyces caeruleatus TaxID=661399 RepID=UPI00099E481E|nr:DUF1569 domain-containing protein [Streptomyces caeruleatus]